MHVENHSTSTSRQLEETQPSSLIRVSTFRGLPKLLRAMATFPYARFKHAEYKNNFFKYLTETLANPTKQGEAVSDIELAKGAAAIRLAAKFSASVSNKVHTHATENTNIARMIASVKNDLDAKKVQTPQPTKAPDQQRTLPVRSESAQPPPQPSVLATHIKVEAPYADIHQHLGIPALPTVKHYGQDLIETIRTKTKRTDEDICVLLMNTRDEQEIRTIFTSISPVVKRLKLLERIAITVNGEA